MKKIYLIFILLLSNLLSFSQSGFKFLSNKKYISIPFKTGNNLIIVPVDLNGVKLNFLLDTGVENTILFSLENADSIQFGKVEKIKIRGLGKGEPIDAFHSTKNKISINEFVDEDHEIFIILDQDVNFSSQLGIPIHGIIGYHFFKNNLIKVDYISKKIKIYKDYESRIKKELQKYDEIPITIEFEKPYLNAIVKLADDKESIETKLLIDTGGSDALWLFEDNKIRSSKEYFNDFLGRGFSGDIYGKRSRISNFSIGNNLIKNPTISFPDAESLKHVNMVNGRNGSVGSGIFNRFTVVFDYARNKIFLKKNKNFEEPFNYNMSGIEIEHSGLQWVKEEVQLKATFVSETNNERPVYESEKQSNLKYQFVLKPRYEIMNVRSNSPAEEAGIKKGDIIQKINGRNVYKYELQDIILLMQSEEGKWIKLEVERNGVMFKTKFQLKKIL